jgi:RNA polymerase sigma-70 factor (ECF subfamily)
MPGVPPFQPAPPAAHATDSRLAAAIRTLLLEGRGPEARERFGEIVARHQRRAARIAYHYLHDAAETDEAVQDAFVKAFGHLPRFRDEMPFEVWFTRILINGCLDRLKARSRRARWMTSLFDAGAPDREAVADPRSTEPSPEERLLGLERRRATARGLDRLPQRQRTVFILTHVDGCSIREVSEVTGLQASTVRVHLFRAIRKLRALLAGGAAAPVARTEDRVG